MLKFCDVAFKVRTQYSDAGYPKFFIVLFSPSMNMTGQTV